MVDACLRTPGAKRKRRATIRDHQRVVLAARRSHHTFAEERSNSLRREALEPIPVTQLAHHSRAKGVDCAVGTHAERVVAARADAATAEGSRTQSGPLFSLLSLAFSLCRSALSLLSRCSALSVLSLSLSLSLSPSLSLSALIHHTRHANATQGPNACAPAHSHISERLDPLRCPAVDAVAMPQLATKVGAK